MQIQDDLMLCSFERFIFSVSFCFQLSFHLDWLMRTNKTQIFLNKFQSFFIIDNTYKTEMRYIRYIKKTPSRNRISIFQSINRSYLCDKTMSIEQTILMVGTFVVVVGASVCHSIVNGIQILETISFQFMLCVWELFRSI